MGCATAFVAPLASAADPPENLIVLPFSNLGSNRALDWIGESLSVTIYDAVSADWSSTVRPEERDDVLRQMNVRKYAPLTTATVLEIAVNADAGLVVTGSYELTKPATGTGPETLQVKARLINARKWNNIKTFEVNGKLDDLSLLQLHLAYGVLEALNRDAVHGEELFLKDHPPVRLDALERYTRGLMATSYEEKYKLFSAATRLQPNFSGACYQLGALYYNRREFRAAAEWLSRVVPGDPRLHLATFQLGLAHYRTGEFKIARDDFWRLSQAAPVGEVWNNLGVAQMRAGDAEATESFAKALELDRSDPVYLFNAGYDAYRRGEYETATQRLRSALERRPDDDKIVELLERCERRQPARAGEALERLKESFDDSAWRQLKAILEPSLRK